MKKNKNIQISLNVISVIVFLFSCVLFLGAMEKLDALEKDINFLDVMLTIAMSLILVFFSAKRFVMVLSPLFKYLENWFDKTFKFEGDL